MPSIKRLEMERVNEFWSDAHAPQRHLSFECSAVEKLAHCAACGKILFPSAGCDARRTRRAAHSLQGNIKYSPLVILVCGIGRGANFLIEQRLREDVIILETSDFVCPAARARPENRSFLVLRPTLSHCTDQSLLWPRNQCCTAVLRCLVDLLIKNNCHMFLFRKKY
jgi:hypothetical protein